MNLRRNPGDAVGSWLFVSGSTGSYLDNTNIGGGRSTTSYLVDATGSDTTISVMGPIMQDPTNTLLTASAGFTIPILSDIGGDPFKVVFGFNTDAVDPSDVCAYITVDERNEMWLVANDGSGFQYSDVGLVESGVWYDCKISFTASNVVFEVNGIATTMALVASAASQWTLTALGVTKTGGSGAAYALIDYAEMHTEGHIARSATY